LQKYLYIALGGALGSIARFWVGSTVTSRLGVRFPYGTLVVNLTACLLMGFAVELFFNQKLGLSESWRFLVVVGFIGTYSTFSTFEWEIFSGMESGIALTAVIYAVVSLVLGLAAVWCGWQAAKAIF
jgi:CrcB protein